MAKRTICLVGRPNTGKSTLFNRIVGKKVAIIEDAPGITRDRIYSSASYNEIPFYLIDTGGIDLSDGDFNQEIRMQVEIGIEEADIIVFVVDAKDGITNSDELIRDMLKKTNKKVIVAINKVDNKIGQDNMYEFYSLGFDEYVSVSAEHGTGVNDLLKLMTEGLEKGYEDEDDNIKISVIGRPNVGKSSLVNALLNEERVIVSNVAGTTRDAIDTKFTYNKEEYTLIDTAGLRKKGKIFEAVEKYSLLRSMKAIDRSDVCLLVLDATTGIVEHDKHIAGYALEAGKPVVIVVNKWDTIDEKDESMKEWKKEIKNNFQFMDYAKIVFLSAQTKKRIHTLMPEVLESYNNSIKEVKTSVINDVIRDAFIETPPASYKGKKLKVYFAHQSGIKPPRFDIEVNSKGLVHFSYYRYLENKIRENIDFSGTPIIIQFKNKGEKEL
ncbi:MAG: ribosome biogenesis GTPase Der [Bacilli bacterium]|nr:ribosome biogenesis GTPase Der [Bacilli bacterium]